MLNEKFLCLGHNVLIKIYLTNSRFRKLFRKKAWVSVFFLIFNLIDMIRPPWCNITVPDHIRFDTIEYVTVQRVLNGYTRVQESENDFNTITNFSMLY
jgi:hypothetical protein